MAEVTDGGQRRRNVEEFKRRLFGVDAWGSRASLADDGPLHFDRTYERVSISYITEETRRLLEQKELRNAEWADDRRSLKYDAPVNFYGRRGQPPDHQSTRPGLPADAEPERVLPALPQFAAQLQR